MSKAIVGIDISKAKFDIALLTPDNKIKSKVFQNTRVGFDELLSWLAQKNQDELHFCMESTGVYGEALAHYLHDNGLMVSVVNPALVKGYAQSEHSRNKTDKVDAKIIARFCRSLEPKSWIPAPKHIRELRAMVMRLDDLQSLEQQERNRLDVSNSAVKGCIEAVLNQLEQQIKQMKAMIRKHIKSHDDLDSNSKLLESIPGVADRTIAQVLAHIGDVERFESAKQLAAYVGLTPKQHYSGSSVKKYTRLSKMGNTHMRKALYMPAIVAKRYNPIVNAFCERLKAAGKSTMCIIGAAMRKLLHIIYGVLKSQKPFNPCLTS